MASDVNSYFFKAENSNLTLEDIRSKGYIAGKTKKGFIEVTFNDSLDYCLKRLDKVEKFDFDECEQQYKIKQNELENLLINGLKPETPRLMRLISSSFGGCMDDYPVLIAYNPDGTREKTKDNYNENSEAKKLFLKEYKKSEYFETVDFIRDTTDHMTQKQKEEIKLLKNKIENQEFKKWKDSQPDLDIGRISLLAISTARKGESRFSYRDNEYKNLDHMERFIREHYNIEDIEK